MPKGVNSFYELYITDKNNNLVDVPVIVTNLRNDKGEKPNGSEFTDSSKLVHRFFVSETVSGIEARGGYLEGDKSPTYLRYAKTIKLSVELDNSNNEAIFKPVLHITYDEYKTSTITEATAVEVEFIVEYFENSDGVRATFLTFFIIGLILVLIIVAIKACNFSNSNPSDSFVTWSTEENRDFIQD